MSHFRSLILPLVMALAWAAPLPSQSAPEHIERSVAMDDGVELSASVFLPGRAEERDAWPAIVFIHGFSGSKNVEAARRAAERGYIGMAYTVRGQGRRPGGAPSGGFSTVQGPREVKDLAAMLDWLKHEFPVNPQKIGVTGGSQGAIHAWMALSERMGVAAAVAENFTAALPEAVIVSGALNSRMASSGSAVALDPEFQKARQAAAQYDVAAIRRLYSPRNYRAKLAGVDTPTMIQFAFKDGWGVANLVLEDYRLLEGPKKLYLGTIGHGSANIAEERRFRDEWRDRWFDRWLKGERNGIEQEPPVEVALLDSWERLSLPSFPPPSISMVNYYLEGDDAAGGRLLADDRQAYTKRNLIEEIEPPSRAFTVQTVRHEPISGFDLAAFYEAGAPLDKALDQIPLSSARYETPPLDEDLLLVGIPQLQLVASGSDGPYPLAVRLWDVDPAERQRLISRAGLVVDQPAELEGHALKIPLSATAYRAEAGHRLRLEISNLDMDWDAEKQDWARLWALPVPQPAEIEIHTGGWIFSLIKLPVLPKRGD